MAATFDDLSTFHRKIQCAKEKLDEVMRNSDNVISDKIMKLAGEYLQVATAPTIGSAPRLASSPAAPPAVPTVLMRPAAPLSMRTMLAVEEPLNISIHDKDIISWTVRNWSRTAGGASHYSPPSFLLNSIPLPPIKPGAVPPPSGSRINKFWLKITKGADDVGLFLCCDADRLIDRKHDIEVDYQLMVKRRASDEMAYISRWFSCTFGEISAWGLPQFSTMRQIAAAGGYNPSEDAITFACKFKICD